MSATLDDRQLNQLLPQLAVIHSARRSFLVERRYQALPAQTRTEEAIAGAVQQLLRLLDWLLRQRLDSQLLSHYTVPTGSRLPLRYQQGEPPVLAVRMQEMFGEQQTPRVAEGRVAVVLELLSHAHRSLQIICALAAFWRGRLSRGAKRDEMALSETPLAGRTSAGGCLPGVPVKRHNGNSEVSAFGQAGVGTE